MKLSAAQKRALHTVATYRTGKHYVGTEGAPNSFVDVRSAEALRKRGLLDTKTQTWKCPSGHYLTAVFWLMTDAGRAALENGS